MIELPDFSPLRTTATSIAPTRAALDRLDHLLIVAARSSDGALARLPYGKQLATLLRRATKNDDELVSTRAANARATGLTVGTFAPASRFATLTWAAKAIRECLRDKPRTLGIALVGLADTDRRAAAESLLAAAGAAAFALPAFKSDTKRPTPRSRACGYSARRAASISRLRAHKPWVTTSLVGSRRCRPTC